MSGSALLACLAAALAAPGAPGQQQSQDLPLNAAQRCPWCQGDPETMRRAGIVSHGGFEFSTTDTAGVDELLGGKDIYWIETEHFRVGFGAGGYKVSQEESRKIREELTLLSAVLPEVKPKTKILDPWLRTHLYAQRVEEIWDRFLHLMRANEADFPDGSEGWVIGSPYHGEGPYAGQKGKYELLVLPTPQDQVAFLRDQFGLFFDRTQRWNIVERDALIVITNIVENDLRDDQALHGHVAFNLTINLLDGYQHYSYDTPRWISEGLAHFVERELSPHFNTFDGSEGAVAQMTSKHDWDGEVRKLISSGEVPTLAELTNLRTFAEFDIDHHYACWSMTAFLVDTEPEGYACLNDRLHGRKDDQGLADGSNMNDHQREAFQECLGMSYAEFDSAWRTWALER